MTFIAHKQRFWTQTRTRSLPSEAKSILKEYSIQKGVSFNGMTALLDKGSRQAGGILKDAIRSASLSFIDHTMLWDSPNTF